MIDVLTSDGSRLTDWGKFKTQSIDLPNGQSVQIHFYQNRVTGKINYTHQDYKVKDIVNEFYPRPPIIPNSKYKPAAAQDILDSYKPKF